MKIICIGRNYHDHIREMGSPLPSEPVFFLKADTAIITRNRPFFYPGFSKDIQYEVEIVLRICRVGKHINARFAHLYYNELGIGIDFTARDVQRDAIAGGLPWEKAKAFDGSAPLSPFVPLVELGDVHNLDFSLKKNGSLVQKGNTANMIFDFERIIGHVSRYFTLKMGDMIFTGTPAGVGGVEIGDVLEAYLGDRRMLKCNIK